MTLFLIAFSLGNIVTQWRGILLPFPGLIAIILSLFILFFLTKKSVFGWLIAAVLGSCLVTLQAHKILQQHLPELMINKKIQVNGFIASIPNYQRDRASFVFKTKEGHLFNLNWYQAPSELQPGQYWQLTIKQKPIHSFANEGVFNYQQGLFSQGIINSGYVISSPTPILLPEKNYFQQINLWRQRLQQRLINVVGDNHESQLLSALTLGLRNGLNRDDWQILQATGTSHLLAISGLHIGLIAGMVFGLSQFFWRRSYRLTNRLSAPRAGAIIAILSALFYLALAGFSLPSQRAFIMIFVMFVWLIWRRKTSVGMGLLWALTLILIWDPMASLQVGFYLSFIAVAFILLAVFGREEIKNFQWLRVQWAVTLGLLPFIILIFQQVSISSLLVNLIAIPWVGFFVLPMALLGILLLPISMVMAKFPLLLACWALEILWHCLTWVAQQPGHFYYSFPNKIAFILALIAVILCLLPQCFPGKKLAFMCVIPLFFGSNKSIEQGQADISVLDVGQGLAVVVRTKNHALLFDAGASSPYGFSAGSNVVLPYLRHENLRHLDKVIISHGDNDHSGGFTAVQAAIPIQEVIVSSPNMLANYPTNSLCHYPQQWYWNEVRFEFLNPSYENFTTKNNQSCVLKISAGEQSILLTGDIEMEAENFLLTNQSTRLSSNILLVPHHGSKTSSGLTFIHRVNPQFAVISSGYLNRFSLPNPKVVAAYEQEGIKVFNTAKEGAVHISLSQHDPIAIWSYRQRHNVYWRVDN